MADNYQPTFIDKLLVLPVLGWTVFAALTRMITGPLFGGARGNTYFKDVAYAALRTNLSIVGVGT